MSSPLSLLQAAVGRPFGTTCNLSAAEVAGPTMPSTLRPRVPRWNARTAASVFGPKMPSTTQVSGVLLVLEPALERGDLRPFRAAEQQDVCVLTDGHGRPWGRSRFGDRADLSLDVTAQDVHVDGARIPLALRAARVLLVPDGARRSGPADD